MTLAEQQKPKLAAMEALFTTTKGAPLIISDWPDPASGKVLYLRLLGADLHDCAYRGELQKDFRQRGIIAGLVLGILTAVEIPVAMVDAPSLPAVSLLHGRFF